MGTRTRLALPWLTDYSRVDMPPGVLYKSFNFGAERARSYQIGEPQKTGPTLEILPAAFGSAVRIALHAGLRAESSCQDLVRDERRGNNLRRLQFPPRRFAAHARSKSTLGFRIQGLRFNPGEYSP